MNVGELIGKLNHFPDGMPVVVRGYEDGFDNVLEVEEIDVAWNANAKPDGTKDTWYYGIHGDSHEPGEIRGVVTIA